MSHPLLERHLERGAVKPLYLFYGDEEFLMNRALLRLEAGLTDRAGEPPSKVVRDAQEVGLPAQLIEGVHLRVSGAEIAEEVADGPAVVTIAFQAERRAERIDGAVEDGSQRMWEARASGAVHDMSLGRGRTCCATARVYCR